jgi:DNA-binding SARP family transcriptional activator/tetratricopeptide (TPR) repeat protein
MFFRVLGPLAVEASGELHQLASAKQRVLLGMLLLEANRVVPADRLLDAMWGGLPPAGGPRNMHVHVYQLRQKLQALSGADDPVLITCPGGYMLKVPPAGRDVDVFAELVASGRQSFGAGDWQAAAQHLRCALALWRGAALADLADHSADFAIHAGRLAEERITAYEDCIEAELHWRPPAELIPELTTLTQSYPIRERLRGQLMLALHRSGRRADALDVYARARRNLRDELGVEPGLALRNLQRKILSEEPDPPPGPQRSWTAVSRLPPTVADFTGRQRQLHEAGEYAHAVRERSMPGQAAILALVGPPGIGKTALAVRLAHLLAADFPDGQIFVDLGGLGEHPLRPEAVLRRVLNTLGVSAEQVPSTLPDQQAMYRSLLARRKVLIVLDNARDEAQVLPLLVAENGCLTVVTSRHLLTNLAGARRLVLDVLTVEESRELLAAITGAERIRAEDLAANAILNICGRLPLALRLVGARMASRPHWRLGDLAERLALERNRLGELAAGGFGIRSAFVLSYAALSTHGQRAFRSAGLVAGPDITADTVACLASLTADVAADTLEELAEASLVQSSRHIGRFHLHDLLRLFAEETAAQDSPTDRAEALSRLLAWYLHRASNADELIAPYRTRPLVDWCEPPFPVAAFEGQKQAVQWCESERSNLVAAVSAAAAAGQHRYAWQLATVMWGYFNHRRLWTEWVSTHEVALASAKAIDDRQAQAQILNQLGNVYQDLHRLDEARDCLEQGLAIRRTLGDRAGESSSLNNLAGTYGLLGMHEKAIEYLHMALAIRVELGNDASVGNTLVNLGDAYHGAGNNVEARRHLEHAVALHQRFDHRHGAAATLVNLADVLVDLAQYDEAGHRLSEGLRIFEDMDNRYGIGFAHHNLGRLALAQGEPERAVDHLRESLVTRQLIGDRRGYAATLDLLGHAQLAVGDERGARETWQRAGEALADLGDPRAEEVRARLPT